MKIKSPLKKPISKGWKRAATSALGGLTGYFLSKMLKKDLYPFIIIGTLAGNLVAEELVLDDEDIKYINEAENTKSENNKQKTTKKTDKQ